MSDGEPRMMRSGSVDLAAADADLALLLANPEEMLAGHVELDARRKVAGGFRVDHGAQRQHQRNRAERPHRIMLRRTDRPASQRLEDRRRLITPRRQLIDLDRRRRRQLAANQYPGLLQPLEPLGQHVGTDSVEARLKVAETAGPEQQFADQRHRPALADQVHAVRGGTGIVVSPFLVSSSDRSYFF